MTMLQLYTKYICKMLICFTRSWRTLWLFITSLYCSSVRGSDHLVTHEVNPASIKFYLSSLVIVENIVLCLHCQKNTWATHIITISQWSVNIMYRSSYHLNSKRLVHKSWKQIINKRLSILPMYSEIWWCRWMRDNINTKWYCRHIS